MSPVIWLFPPDCSAAAVFERLPATASPPEIPAATLAAPIPTSSRAGIDAVSAPRGEQPAGCEPFGERNERERHAADKTAPTSSRGIHGRPIGGRPAGTSPIMATPFASRSNAREADDAAEQDDQPPRHTGDEPSTERQHQRARPRRPARSCRRPRRVGRPCGRTRRSGRPAVSGSRAGWAAHR